MNVEEAYEKLKVTEEEKNSIKKYMGFSHTMMNILADLDPKRYNELEKSGWHLPEELSSIEKNIEDFANVYSAMKKKSIDSRIRDSLTRGTSNKEINKLQKTSYKEFNQILSTSRSRDVAKRFCEYGDSALIEIWVEEGVPFLDVEEFRDENHEDEREVILSPFCKISEIKKIRQDENYTYYSTSVEAPKLEDIPEDQINALKKEVLEGFKQNIEESKEYCELENKLEWLHNKRNSKGIDREDLKYINKDIEATSEQYRAISEKINSFKEKINTLLKGLCRQKEIEIEEAKRVIEEDKERKEQEVQENVKKQKKKEISSRIEGNTATSGELQNRVMDNYQAIIKNEEYFRRLADTLGVSYTKVTDRMTLNQQIQAIQENIGAIQTELRKDEELEQSSSEDMSEKYKIVVELTDRCSMGNEISKVLPEITELHRQQSENEIKRNLYQKVQQTIKNGQLQKYQQELNKAQTERPTFLGRFTGKNKLIKERVNNLNLKMRLLSEKNIDSKSNNLSIREMLADLYVSSWTQGRFTPEMSNLYNTIKSVFLNNEGQEFSDEYIMSLASQKMQSNNNLPIEQGKTGLFSFRRNRMEAQQLRMESKALSNEIMSQMVKKNSLDEYRNVDGEDAIQLFDSKLKDIQSVTRKERDTRNIEHTLGRL